MNLDGRWWLGHGSGRCWEKRNCDQNIMCEKNLNDFRNWKGKKKKKRKDFIQYFVASLFRVICSVYWLVLITLSVTIILFLWSAKILVPLSPAAAIPFVSLTPQWSWTWLVLHQSLGGSILQNSRQADIKIAVRWVLGLSHSEGCTVPETLSYLAFSLHTWSSFPVSILNPS